MESNKQQINMRIISGKLKGSVLFMPKDKGHEQLAVWSKRNWKGKSEKIKRITTSVKKIKKILDKSVFKKYAAK